MKKVTKENLVPESQLLMLQLQIEELEARLEKTSEQHRKAASRATASEKRNRTLRDQIEDMEGDFRILATCWQCPDLGKKGKCSSCSNSAVFIETDAGLQWRGICKTKGRY